MYPNAEIKCTRLDQEGEDALCFACSSLLAKLRAQDAPVLPRERVTSSITYQTHIPCSNED